MGAPYIDLSELALLRTPGLPGAGSGLRASDAERERAAQTLRRHHADGRLTMEELEERTERAYAGRRWAIWISCSGTCRGCARPRASGGRGGYRCGRRRSPSRSSRRSWRSPWSPRRTFCGSRGR